jgi:hypothetical protein
MDGVSKRAENGTIDLVLMTRFASHADTVPLQRST